MKLQTVAPDGDIGSRGRILTSRKRRRGRRSIGVSYCYYYYVDIVIVALWIICGWCGTLTVTAAQNHQDTVSKKYSWQDYNYYQILGLEEPPPSSEALHQQKKKETTKKKRTIGIGGGSGSDHSNSKKKKDDGPSRQDLLKNQSTRRKLSLSDIKKAYRSQAQVWHPDKVILRHNQEDNVTQNGSSNDAETTSTKSLQQEATDRFALISEAYEVLKDVDQKRDYDEDLAQNEMSSLRQRQREYLYDEDGSGETPSSWSDLFRDPMGAFDNFMNGDFDYFQSSSGTRYSSHDGRRRPYLDTSPDSISEKTETYYDPYHGGTIYRIYRKEEWHTQQYYRILQQDFIIVDRGRYGGGVSYEPIGAGPTLTEEGYLYDLPFNNRNAGGNFHHQYSQYQSNHGHKEDNNLDWMETVEYKQYKKKARERKTFTRHQHVMLDLEYFTLESEPLRSQNGQYLAYISDVCELVIEKHNTDNDIPHSRRPSFYNQFNDNEAAKNTVVWTSGSYYPAGSCFLALIESQLVLLAGKNPNHVTSVLWTTPGDNEEDEVENDDNNNPTWYYYLALEDEGVLVVYKTKHKNKSKHMGRPLPRVHMLQNLQNILDHTAHAVCQASIINAGITNSTSTKGYDRKHRNILKGPCAENDDDDKDRNKQAGNEDDLTDRCTWASSSFTTSLVGGGCSNIGRRMTALAAQVKESSTKASSNIRKTFDDVINYFHNHPRDLDAVDTITRVLKDTARLALFEQRTAMTLMSKRYHIWKRQLYHLKQKQQRKWERLVQKAASSSATKRRRSNT